MPVKTSSYRPPWWLNNKHAQTIIGLMVRLPVSLKLSYEYIELPDGDFLELAWAGTKGPITLFLSGVEGNCLESTYARSILKNIVSRGNRAVFVHHRGCGTRLNRLHRSYLAGDTADIRYVINEIHRREPSTTLYAVGISIGANKLLKYLGEDGAKTPIQKAFAASVPFEIGTTISVLNQSLGGFYQRAILRWLRRRLYQKMNQLDYSSFFSITQKGISKIQTLRDFDQLITLPITGLTDLDDYYTQASCRAHLHKIQVPTLIVHAQDDTFMTPASIPNDHEISHTTTLELSAGGGHVGFVHGVFPWSPRYWLEERIVSFLNLQAPETSPKNFSSPTTAAPSI